MKTIQFDATREDMLSDWCIDDTGRYVPREDFEAAAECREALRRQKHEEQIRPLALLLIAAGMIVAVGVMLAGGRI